MMRYLTDSSIIQLLNAAYFINISSVVYEHSHVELSSRSSNSRILKSQHFVIDVMME